MKCKICNKELKRIGYRHLWTNKCLKITNDLNDKIDTMENGTNAENELLGNTNELYIEMKQRYKELTNWRRIMEFNRY